MEIPNTMITEEQTEKDDDNYMCHDVSRDGKVRKGITKLENRKP